MLPKNNINLWKQYLRLIPAYLGLFNKGAFLHQIDAIYKDDLFIVSFPKSGNTWLRFIIASFFHNPQTINNRSIDVFVPDIYRNKKNLNAQKSNRILKTHHTFFKYHPKSVYIIRDYRDVVVSFYFYLVNAGLIKTSLAQFINNDALFKPFGSWASHVKAALDFKELHPERILIVKYEDLLAGNAQTIRQLHGFCQGTRSSDADKVYELFRFEKLKQDEQQHGSYYMDYTQQPFYRKGKQGDWKNHLDSKMEQELLNHAGVRDLMKQFDYLK